MLQSGRAWDTHIIDSMFSADDATDIKQIAIGGPEMDDYLAWNHTKNGQFTVRSAYHLKMAMNRAKSGQPESSLSMARLKG